MARVDRGETPQHDYADAAAQTRLVALFRRDDEMIEELVSAYLGPREGNAVPQIDVQRHVAGALAAGDAGRAPIHANAVENRVLAAMRNCGWMATRRTINKRRVRAWEKPGVEPTSAVKRTPAASSGPADGREPF